MPVEQSSNAAAQLSLRFHEQNKLGFGCLLVDGFQISEFEDGASSGSSIKAVVVDRQRDTTLEQFVERCRKKLRKARDDATQAMVLALLVSDACGRSGVHANDLQRRHNRMAEDKVRQGRGNSQGHQDHGQGEGELLLGDLLGDWPAAAERRSRHPTPGAGLACHRALLFKALADWLGLFDCSLEQLPEAGGLPLPRAVWNVVQLQSASCVVDLLLDPGALYEERTARAQEHLRLLASGECYRSAGRLEAPSPLPPSARNELAGQMPRPPWHAEPWELEIRRSDRIGRGGFGEVFHGCWAGVHVAVKEIKDATPTDAEVVDFILEIALLSQLNHPNIVRFWRGSIETRAGSRSLLMVTEYIKTGGLSRLLHGHGGPALPEPLTLLQALSFGLDIARGVQYLHSQRVLHLDLKSPNVLCAAPWTAKLCDFGLAKIRGEHTVVQSTLQGVSPVWAPPEMLDERVGGLTEKADVYSFAIIFFELLTKRIPFQEVSQTQLPLLKAAGQLPQIPREVPEDCTELIRQCCTAKPGGRPSMSGVVARVREVAQHRNLQFSEVRPPASLLRGEEGPERRAREAEEAAAQRLAELGGQRVRVRAELDELQRKISEVRRQATDAAARQSDGSMAAAGSPLNESAWCEAFVQDVAGARFRCGLCCKLFRGAEFVRRHIVAKHQAEAGQLTQGEQGSQEPAKASTSGKPGVFSQALQDAASRGDAATVTTLLAQRASPAQQDDGGAGPLCLATRHGHGNVVRLLLEVAASPGGRSLVNQATGAGLTALHVAASEGHCELASALLGAGAVVDVECARGKTPLLHAGEGGHTAACALLVKAKADARRHTPEGETLLHVASRCGDADLVAQVVSWRADLQAQDREGWTALHEAAHWGAVAVEALCAAGAPVDARAKDGGTALHAALGGFERLAACQALLRWRADARAADALGDTPLHGAARRGHAEICRALLAHGADAAAKNTAGRTPVDLAPEGPAREELLGGVA